MRAGSGLVPSGLDRAPSTEYKSVQRFDRCEDSGGDFVNILDLEKSAAETGLCNFVSDFYTEHFVIQAKLTSPERRLSDHLNSSVSTVDVRPLAAVQHNIETETELAGGHAQVVKSRILFVVPLSEPERPRAPDNSAWKATTKYAAWGGTGPYSFRGSIHSDTGRDPQFVLRLLDKQFVPFTGVTVTLPDGSRQSYPAILVNRLQLDMLSLEGRS